MAHKSHQKLNWSEKYPLVTAYHAQHCQEGYELKVEPQKKITLQDSNVVFYVQPAIKEHWSIVDIVQQCQPPSWEKPFLSAGPELQRISKILQTEEATHGPFFPRKEHIFRAFTMCPLPSVKVVIVGQDPYPSVQPNGLPVAQGMSFSIPKNVRLTASLRNIYAELKRSIPEFIIPQHGDLSQWATQGVLLLNSTLTVRAGDYKHIHTGLWDSFIRKILKAINEINPNTIYMLWGKPAQNIKKLMSGKYIAWDAYHPSSQASNRGYNFVGCDHFVNANRILTHFGTEPIDWQLSLE